MAEYSPLDPQEVTAQAFAQITAKANRKEQSPLDHPQESLLHLEKPEVALVAPGLLPRESTTFSNLLLEEHLLELDETKL